MGHTVPPFTWQFQKEEAYFSKFIRALLLAEDKKRFKDLWRKAEFHMPAAEKASHPLPVATILMMMNLEQEKAIYQLERRLQTQAQKIAALEKTQAQDEARILYLSKRLESTEAGFENRLAAFRQEMLAIKFVDYDYTP
jgi:predicted  nucleic acid-binding Zn-ribbon protein